MLKQKTKEIVAIYTLVNGRKSYVTPHISTRTVDNKKFVYYSIEPEKARDFETEQNAQLFIPTIVNPQSKVFYIESTTVDADKHDQFTAAVLR